MKSYYLEFNQLLPISLAEAWAFFSNPLNLEKITPAEMAFTVTSKLPEPISMYPGMIITYRVSPMLGVKLNWMTEITHVEEEKYFIDEQRFGPYQFWHHQHHFEKVAGGVMMHDILTYGLPLGIFGRMANNLFVAAKLQQIFGYRKKQIELMFGNQTIGT